MVPMTGAGDFLRLKMAVSFISNYIHFYIFRACSVTFHTVRCSQPQYQELEDLPGLVVRLCVSSSRAQACQWSTSFGAGGGSRAVLCPSVQSVATQALVGLPLPPNNSAVSRSGVCLSAAQFWSLKTAFQWFPVLAEGIKYFIYLSDQQQQIIDQS